MTSRWLASPAGFISRRFLTRSHIMSFQPLPPFIERNPHAQGLLPGRRQVVDFFKAALDDFRRSKAEFNVICTIRPPASNAATPTPRPAPAPIKPTEPVCQLIVFDSSFNPPTIAHLRMTRSGLLAAPRARVLLLLAINNADKGVKPASFEQRLAMMMQFTRDAYHTDSIASSPMEGSATGGGASAFDIGLTTLPYFHDKSRAIYDSGFYSTDGDGTTKPEQIFLAGFDTLIRIFNPKYYTAGSKTETPMQAALSPFFARARLRVTMRTDDDWGDKADQEAYVDGLLNTEQLDVIGGRREWARRIDLVEGRKEGEKIVSSTVARGAAKSKDWNSLSDLVSPTVASWIKDEGLYTDD